MIASIRARLRHDDRGITLIELMVYSALSVVVISLAGALVANSARVNTTVQTTAQTTGVGQVIARSLSTGVLNADWASTPTTGTTQFFTVHTAGRGATVTWSCQAWYFTSSNGGAMYTTTSSSAITAPTGTPTGWILLGTGISAVGSTPVFAGSGTGIVLSMNVSNGGAKPVLISTTVTKRQSASGVTSCQ